MNLRSLVPSLLGLGLAALLLAPLGPSRAYSKTGQSLDEGQRDFRVFDNFQDAGANDNITPAAMFPGFLGAEVALWKGVIEWNSAPHGDGSGDPVGGNVLGSGGAAFDAFFAGVASGIGDSNANVISALDCGGGGTLAFTEFPVSDGWRIRFCDEWEWDDGPGNVPLGTYDLQGVLCHEYGHALGLGHSLVHGATMAPAVTSSQESARSIEADDKAGIQCVYGAAPLTKPTIAATVADAGAGTLTIHGANFDALDNEIWLTSATASAPGSDPIVRVPGVASQGGGTVITLAIPAGAGPGDVIVNTPGPGGATLSNAFPTDLVGTLGMPPVPHPDLTAVTPATIEALIPGTAQTITLAGVDMDLVTSVLLDGVPIAPARYTIVGDTTITLDTPQASSLGAHELGVSDGAVTDELGITVVAPAGPRLQWGTGDPLAVVDRDDGLDMILSGLPGELHVVRGSPNGPPALDPHLRPAPGNPGAVLLDAGAYVIPPEGWLAVHLGGLPDPARVGATWFARSFALVPPRPYPASNDQSITLVP